MIKSWHIMGLCLNIYFFTLIVCEKNIKDLLGKNFYRGIYFTPIISWQGLSS